MPEDFDNIPETEWAYLAGLMDGEGCINVTITTGGAYALQIKVSQKNKADLLKIQNLFGGCMSGKKDGSSWQLYWGAKSGEPILRRTFPYLKWKKEEAEHALSFICEVMNGKGYKQNKPLGQFIKEQLTLIKEAKYA